MKVTPNPDREAKRPTMDDLLSLDDYDFTALCYEHRVFGKFNGKREAAEAVLRAMGDREFLAGLPF